MLTRLGLFGWVFLLSACGALLSREVRQVERIELSRSAPMVQPGHARLRVHDATAHFDVTVLEASLSFRLWRERLCEYGAQVRYRENVWRKREPSPSGMLFDGGVVVGGLIAGLLTRSLTERALVSIGAVIPLGVDAYLLQREVVEKGSERTYWEPITDPVGVREEVCQTEVVENAAIRWNDVFAENEGSAYYLRLSEPQLTSVPLSDALLVLDVAGETVTAPFSPGSSFAIWRRLLNEARDEKSLAAMARYVMGYPQSLFTPRIREAFSMRIAVIQSSAELQSLLDLEGLPVELRRVVQKRYAQVRVVELEIGVAEKLQEAVRADREVTTYRLNRLDAESERAKVSLREALREVCRMRDELRMREPEAMSRRLTAWRQAIEVREGPVAAAKALKWIEMCGIALP